MELLYRSASGGGESSDTERCGGDVDNVAAYLDSFAVIFVCLSPDPQLSYNFEFNRKPL